MTREEAIVYFEKILAGAKRGLEEHPEVGKRVYGMRKELAEIALTALRPVSREQVEKVWRGEWTQGGYACGEHEWECSKCHETEWRTSCSRLKFCPFCGAPMTDDAVDMVMERLEALKDGKSD